MVSEMIVLNPEATYSRAVERKLYNKVVRQAVQELINICDQATSKELSRLSEELFNPVDPSKCIYGMLTGNCTGPRALTLNYKCALPIRYLDGNFERVMVSSKLNYVSTVFNRKQLDDLECSWILTPLESVILHIVEENRPAFIKGIKYYLNHKGRRLSLCQRYFTRLFKKCIPQKNA